MTTTLLALTAHQLLGRRRGILIALMALLPIGLALLFRLAGEGGESSQFAADMVGGLVITLLLPIGALVFGTSALGAEIEDGTIVYLLAKPVARWRIVVAKAAVASLATAALVVPATLLTVVIVLDGLDAEYLWWGAAAASIVGSIVYSTLFVGVSTVTGRALVVGLVYVFVWEALITNIFEGTRWVSVRQYAFAIADAITTAEPVSSSLTGSQALVASAVVVTLSLAVGARFLQRFEIGEQP